MEALSNEVCFNRCSSLPSFPPVCYSFVIVPPSPLSAFMSQASFYPSWLLLYLLLIYFYLFIHLPSSNIPPPFFCLFCTTFTDMYIHICVPYKLEWVRKWEFCLSELESPCLLLTLQIHPFFYKFHFYVQLNKFTLYKCSTFLSSFLCWWTSRLAPISSFYEHDMWVTGYEVLWVCTQGCHSYIICKELLFFTFKEMTSHTDFHNTIVLIFLGHLYNSVPVLKFRRWCWPA